MSQPVPARLPCRQLRFLPRFARSCSICLRRLFQELLFSCHGVAENGFDVRRFFSQQSSNAVDQRSKKYTQQNDHTPHGEPKHNRAKKENISRGTPHGVPMHWSNSWKSNRTLICKTALFGLYYPGARTGKGTCGNLSSSEWQRSQSRACRLFMRKNPVGARAGNVGSRAPRICRHLVKHDSRLLKLASCLPRIRRGIGRPSNRQHAISPSYG